VIFRIGIGVDLAIDIDWRQTRSRWPIATPIPMPTASSCA